MILVVGGAFQGKVDFVINELKIEENKIFRDFHLKMKSIINDNKSVDEFINYIFNSGFDVIISDEIGSGIVPIDKGERIWREEVGRALCEIVKKCDEVWRVQIGIGTRIK